MVDIVIDTVCFGKAYRSIIYNCFLNNHHIYTERMMVSCFLWCLRSDLHKILQEGRPLDQRGWKISKLWLPWQPLPWQPKNLPRAHKTPKRLWISNRRGIGWEENCCHDFMLPWQPLSFHGNQKNVPLKVNRLEKNVLRRCHNVVVNDLGDVWWHCDVTLAG